MMENKNESYWGDLADSYDMIINEVIGERSRRDIYNIVLGLKDLGNAIEFGCGPGYFTRAIARNAGHVLATDLSDRMLETARRNLAGTEGVEFRKVNWDNTGLPADSFDTAFTANVIQIVEDPEKALSESNRILKHGGRLFVLFYSNIGMSVFDRFVFLVRFLRWFKLPPYRRMMSPEEIRNLALRTGFEVERVSVVGGKVKAVFLQARKP